MLPVQSDWLMASPDRRLTQARSVLEIEVGTCSHSSSGTQECTYFPAISPAPDHEPSSSAGTFDEPRRQIRMANMPSQTCEQEKSNLRPHLHDEPAASISYHRLPFRFHRSPTCVPSDSASPRLVTLASLRVQGSLLLILPLTTNISRRHLGHFFLPSGYSSYASCLYPVSRS